MKTRTLLSVVISSLVLVLMQLNASAADHPHYLQALSDLRGARWMIEHHPGDWGRSDDETTAVSHIDLAIKEITKASIDDGKKLTDHPPVDEIQDHMGRLREAFELLQKARKDVNQEEDDAFANGLKARALKHISEAITRTKKAITS
jgi:hypothetical protein